MKSVTIIGAGESGVGAALLAKKMGMDVFVSDFGSIAEHYKKELTDSNVPFEEGGHDFEKVLVTDVVVKSPGVPEHATVLRMLKEKGRKVISEIEFGHSFFSGLTIAVTGSNGKTTTSGLLYHVLKTAGLNVALGGNYGRSFARIIAEDAPEVMVLEISSFQLDDIETFKPHIAILLNITPDHLDRYEYKMANYVNAKFRVAMNQTSADYFIINGDDPEITNKMQEFAGEQKVIRITEDAYLQGIVSKDASRILNIEEHGIAAGLKSFVNLPHRLESCGEINGIEFINDSKATNVDSVYYALDAMTKSVIWIAGGTDKGNDYSVLFPLIKDRVKALICLGMDNEKLKSSFKSHIPIIYETTKVSEAVETGLKLGESGDVVLLSPACASFDLFKNYMDRGDQFKACVEGLKISN